MSERHTDPEGADGAQQAARPTEGHPAAPTPPAPERSSGDAPAPGRAGQRAAAAAASAAASMGIPTPVGESRKKRHLPNYAAAVYGSVLAASVVISAGDLRQPVTLATLLVASGLVFWIAHVYAATVASVHGGWHYGAIRTGMAHEWPVAFASIPPAIAALIAGAIPTITLYEGAWAALIVAIAEQQLWGYAAVKNARLSGSALTRTMLLNVFMGFIIVALKLGVGH